MAFDLFKGIFGGADYYGSKPVVPDVGGSAAKAIKANEANLPAAEGLAGKVDQFNYDTLQKYLDLSNPHRKAISDQQGKVFESLLKGELPADVLSQINRTSAYKQFSGGFAGSQAGAGLTARDVGTTSLNLITGSLDSASRWMESQAKMNASPMLDVTSMFVTPEQMFNRDFAQAKIDSAPDPVKRGRFDTEMGILGMAVSIYGGQGYNNTDKPSYRNMNGGGMDSSYSSSGSDFGSGSYDAGANSYTNWGGGDYGSSGMVD